MSWLSLAEIARMSGGQLRGDDRDIAGISTDTRTLAPGDLFIALQGENFDGHDYVSDIDTRAGAVLVSRTLEARCPQIRVDDTLVALARFAANWRKRIQAPLIGLTGSNGKTTVKEMIASILAVSHRVFATRGNLNNHIGVPLSLLSVRAEDDFAVIEMGANHAGEIASLTHIARPDIALITNAGPAHLEGFGSIQGVSRAKGEIFQGLPQNGVAVINADDDYAEYWLDLCDSHRRVTFGFDDQADVRGEMSAEGLMIKTDRGEINIKLPLPGRHNAANALAATAAVISLNISLEDIQAGLESVSPVAGRLVMTTGIRGCTVLDDTYNANPESLKAALQVQQTRSGRRWLVLGEMGELGGEADKLHADAGHTARVSGVEKLLGVGPLTRHAVIAFGLGGFHFPTVESLNEYLREQVKSDVNVLVKGSRLMHMEQSVRALASTQAANQQNVEEQGNAA